MPTTMRNALQAPSVREAYALMAKQWRVLAAEAEATAAKLGE
jgi:hypothetical protein